MSERIADSGEREKPVGRDGQHRGLFALSAHRSLLTAHMHQPEQNA